MQKKLLAIPAATAALVAGIAAPAFAVADAGITTAVENADAVADGVYALAGTAGTIAVALVTVTLIGWGLMIVNKARKAGQKS